MTFPRRPRFLLSLLFAAAAPATANYAAEAVTAKLPSTFFVWENLEAKPTANGARREVTNRPTVTLESLESHISTLKSGMSSHAPHRHAREEFIILKEGQLEASINGKVQPVSAGSLMFFASNDWHNVKNVGDQPATYLVFNVETAATHTAPADGAAAAAQPGKQGSAVFGWETLKEEKTTTGTRRSILDSPTTTCAHLKIHVVTLDPGQIADSRWRHPEEELLVVKDGKIAFTLNGKTQSLTPGSIFFCAANDEHGIQNTGTKPATYYSVRILTDLTAPVTTSAPAPDGATPSKP